ncbi:hypothetical protein ONZ45_g8883 [Pleurotus djamor]|nr:hypothetical protein ONZ45_g8883 [Pleurotus djamor]
MASLLERLSAPQPAGPGPIRSRSSQSRSSTPYNRPNRPPKGDIDSPWSHDLYEQHNSLSARLNLTPSAPKTTITAIAQKALRDATTKGGELNIKGAGSQNVVEITGLVEGTTAEDVAAIFKRCGTIVSAKAVPGGEPKIRVTFKDPASATSAVQKFNGQVADGKTLAVRVVGATTTSLVGRLGGGADGLGLVQQEGSVDVLMNSNDSGSKLRSDSLLGTDPRAQVLLSPPGANPADYTQASSSRGGQTRGRGRGRGRGIRGRRGGRNGTSSAKMELD